MAAGGLSRERMQGIALATRRAKQYGIDGAGWREQARARAAEHGFGAGRAAALQAHRPDRRRASPTSEIGWRSDCQDRMGLTGMHNTFARRHALAEIAGAFPQGATLSTRSSATTSAYLNRPLGTRAISRTRGRSRATRPSACLRASSRSSTAPNAELADGGGRARSPSLSIGCSRGSSRRLNEDQAARSRAHIERTRRRDRAGHGRDREDDDDRRASRRPTEQAGWRVVGAAPTGRAARAAARHRRDPGRDDHTLLLRSSSTGGFRRAHRAGDRRGRHGPHPR